jgi:two-component system NarL family response regulator
VVIADDEPHFRHGLHQVLEDSPVDIEVVGEAVDGEDAVEKVRDLRPDVLLLDVRMPHEDGLTAASTIGELVPETKVLMLTVSDSPEDIALATKVGAAGYLLKDCSLQEVAEAVVSLAHGLTWPLAAG